MYLLVKYENRAINGRAPFRPLSPSAIRCPPSAVPVLQRLFHRRGRGSWIVLVVVIITTYIRRSLLGKKSLPPLVSCLAPLFFPARRRVPAKTRPTGETRFATVLLSCVALGGRDEGAVVDVGPVRFTGRGTGCWWQEQISRLSIRLGFVGGLCTPIAFVHASSVPLSPWISFRRPSRTSGTLSDSREGCLRRRPLRPVLGRHYGSHRVRCGHRAPSRTSVMLIRETRQENTPERQAGENGIAFYMHKKEGKTADAECERVWGKGERASTINALYLDRGLHCLLGVRGCHRRAVLLCSRRCSSLGFEEQLGFVAEPHSEGKAEGMLEAGFEQGDLGSRLGAAPAAGPVEEEPAALAEARCAGQTLGREECSRR